jgi:enamine deaminase RidA (YjgF/YER057c/UK114 family)
MDQDLSGFTTVKKILTDDFEVIIVTKAHLKKYYLNANLQTIDDPCMLFEQVAKFLKEENAHITTQDFFGNCSLHTKYLNCLEQVFGEIVWPVTWIEGYGSEHDGMTGTQLYAISGISVEPVKLENQIIGSLFETDDAQICCLGNVLPDDVTLSNIDQTAIVFQKIDTALKGIGMDFSNVVRTWLYINNILEWYDDFNVVRTKFFNENNVFKGLVPASTGVGVANPANAALVAEVMAIKNTTGNVKIEPVISPLQCPALDYRSSFSRAVEVKFSDHRRLYVSGTASIDADGRTVHIGNVEKQIARTMEVVAAILESRQMDWNDITRSIAYFPDLSNKDLLGKYCKEMSIPHMPIAIAKGDICRKDLLFEIEVDAVKTDV